MGQGFKTGLFGFRKKDVVAYLLRQQNEHDAEKESLNNDAARLAEQKKDLDAKVKELTLQTEELAAQRAALISQKDEMAASLQQKEKLCTELVRCKSC